MTTIRHLFWLALAMVGAATGAVDLAFTDVDVNRDALVDRAELVSAGLFEAHDLDGDGGLTPDQLGNPTLFAAWDTNRDNFIEPAEFYDGILVYADINGDGRLDSLEFQRALVEWEAGELAERPG